MAMIHCQQLTMRYGQHQALQDINLTLSQGSPIALVGPNGAGKTTLLSLICGYIQPSQGTLSVMGYPAGHPALCGKLSALPQDAQFDPHLTIAKQLCYYAQLQGYSSQQAMLETQRVLAAVDLTSTLSMKAHTLSHGMQKRIAIAQALIGNPQLVLLDEPTAGLDPINVRSVRKLINDLADQTTFIISSHNLDELDRLTHRVLYLENGHLTQHSTLDVTHHGYIQIRLAALPNQSPLHPIEVLKQLPGVLEVNQGLQHQYIIHYQQDLGIQFDQSLLGCIAQHGWEYDQLIKGKTLEEQLFT